MPPSVTYPALSDRQCDDHFLYAVERVSQRHWPIADRDYARFSHAFEQQMQTEEELMFPALQKSLGTKRGPVADLRADHDHMRTLARRVGDALRERDAEEFFEAATILRALMQQHRFKEAGIIHPIVDRFAANPDVLPLPESCKPGGREPHGKRRANMKAALALLALWAGLGSQPAGAATPGEVGVGERLRGAAMQPLGGAARDLASFAGKPLLINVWASWCGPCRQEMPSVDRLARRYDGRQFNVIGISTDDYPERASAFLHEQHASFSNFIDQHLQLENMLGASELPLTLLVDAQGRVRGKFYGARDWNTAESRRLIASYLRVKL